MRPQGGHFRLSAQGLPNALHVGYDESLRLLGPEPEEGPVARVMRWAHGQPDDVLGVVHVRDWHDARDATQREHLEQFGAHCIAGTRGAEFVFRLDDVRPGEVALMNDIGDVCAGAASSPALPASSVSEQSIEDRLARLGAFATRD